MSSIKPKVTSPTKARASASKTKSIDPNALPEFKAPVIKKAVIQPTAPILPTEFAQHEQRAMEQRLASLKIAMAEERAKREETMKQRELNPVNQISGSEYRSQLKDRLARKAEAMKEKQAALAGQMKNVDLSGNPHVQPKIPTQIQPVKQSNNQTNNQSNKQSSPTSLSSRTSQSITIEQLNNPNNPSGTLSSYVPPVRSNDLTAFQTVSERWLSDEKEVLIDSGSVGESAGLSNNWLDALREAQPVPRPVITLDHEQPAKQSVKQSNNQSDNQTSLIDGDAFDEAESAKSFQEARLAWLTSMQRPQTSKKESSAGTINQSNTQSHHDAPDTQSTRVVTRPTTASAGSLLDGPEFDESQSANAFADARKEWLNSLNASNQSANQSNNQSDSQSIQMKNAPRPMIEATEERFCCYNCYRLTPLRQCILSRGGKPQQMCSESCRDKFEQSQKQQAQSLAKVTSDLVRGTGGSPVNATHIEAEPEVVPLEPVVHMSRPQTASSFDRQTTAMTGRLIHTVTESVAQPKPKVQFPDDD